MKYELLSVMADAKTRKGNKFGYLTGVLYLSPATEADGIHNLCPFKSDQCTEACLRSSGMMGFPRNVLVRKRKTLEYLADEAAFADKLARDVERLIVDAAKQNLTPAVRINGTSDQPQLARRLANRFPQVQFYDYTKIPQPWKRTLANYHLTFSFSGSNFTECHEALLHGINVAVVFAGPLPAEWRGFPVVDGDQSDLRFVDPVGVIVGLKTKGAARKMQSGGFIQIGVAA